MIDGWPGAMVRQASNMFRREISRHQSDTREWPDDGSYMVAVGRDADTYRRRHPRRRPTTAWPSVAYLQLRGAGHLGLFDRIAIFFDKRHGFFRAICHHPRRHKA